MFNIGNNYIQINSSDSEIFISETKKIILWHSI